MSVGVIARILAMKGLIPPNELRSSDERVKGMVSTKEYFIALAESLDLEFVDLENYPIDIQVVSVVPGSFLHKHHMIPVEKTSTGALKIAMSDPSDLNAIDDVMSLTSAEVIPVVADENAIQGVLNNYVRSDEELHDISATLESLAGEEDTEDDGEDDSDEPVVKFVNLVISQAINDRATDIHIEPQEKDMRVRYRIDGVLHEVHFAPKAIQNGVISRLKIMAGLDIAERRTPQDGRFSITQGAKKIDLRITTLPTVWGENVVMRLLDTSSAMRISSDMGMSEHNYKIFEEAFKKPHGMILATGPTGSGKSTTLYTTLNKVSTPEVKVITVEDPVEYSLQGINQVSINEKTGLSFGATLRSIVRADPDIILVGEIRDNETAKISIEAALTGHLVLSTLHTNDAPGAITRLIEMGIEPFLVGSSLECVVAQRLVRNLCGNCKKPTHLTAEIIESLKMDASPGDIVYEPVGCTACSGTGYYGRVAIYEVMKISENIQKLIVAKADNKEIMTAAVGEGMATMREDGWRKVLNGETSIKEILRVSV